MYLVGTHDRSLDEKGRLVLPAIFRADFSEYAFLSPTGTHVAMHTEAGYHEMIERFKAQVDAGTFGLTLLRRIGSATEPVRVDAQGRVGLSPRLREKASLGSEVKVCGVIDHIEIWNAADWDPDSEDPLLESFWRGGGI
ncbi:MAG: hypothetical protein NZ654_11445 [Acidimicrobiales bacterium]|nr:hypothetical protein [Acidimicrobiales bacterium]